MTDIFIWLLKINQIGIYEIEMDAPVSEQPGEMAAGDSGNDEKGVQRRWAIDERDPEIAVEMSGFGDAIPGERRQVLTPTDFQNHPIYVASNQSPDSRRRRGSNSGMRDVLPDKFAGRIPWTDYRRHFDVCMRLNRWNDVEAGQFLATRLQGAALKVLNNIPIGRELILNLRHIWSVDLVQERMLRISYWN